MSVKQVEHYDIWMWMKLKLNKKENETAHWWNHNLEVKLSAVYCTRKFIFLQPLLPGCNIEIQLILRDPLSLFFSLAQA